MPEKITWMRIREAGKKTKFIVSKDPFKAQADYFLWGGKMSPKITLKAPLEIYLQYDSGKHVRTTLQDWEVGKFAYLDGIAAPTGEKAKQIVTQSKGIMSQMGSLFGGSKPAPPKTPPKAASSGGMFGSSGKVHSKNTFDKIAQKIRNNFMKVDQAFRAYSDQEVLVVADSSGASPKQPNERQQ